VRLPALARVQHEVQEGTVLLRGQVHARVGLRSWHVAQRESQHAKRAHVIAGLHWVCARAGRGG
jgi:hypothetical protein